MIGDAATDTPFGDRPRSDLESCIASARDGDKEALGQALESFRKYLLLVANKGLDPALRTKKGASDLVQESLLLAYRDFAYFRGRTKAEWQTWLKTILVNHLTSQRRQLASSNRRLREVAVSHESQLGWIDEAPTPGAELARREREAVVTAAVLRLSERHRRVVIEHYREKRTYEEIGRRMGIDAEAVRKLWTRALKKLREELGSTHE